MLDSQWIEILKGAMIFGVPLVALASVVVQFIKRKTGLEGENAKLLALGIGWLFGAAYLLLFYPPLSWQDALVKVVAALVFAFITPELYSYVKELNAKGMEKHIEDAERKAFGG